MSPAEAGRRLAREHKAQGHRLSPEQIDAAARILAAAARERMQEQAA